MHLGPPWGFHSHAGVLEVASSSHFYGAVEYPLLEAFGGGELFVDSCVYLFPEAGHAAHACRAHLLDGTLNDVRVGIYVDDDAAVEAEVGPRFFEDVAKREEAERCVVFGEHREALFVYRYGSIEGAVGQYGALGLAGGAGGVDERGHVVG